MNPGAVLALLGDLYAQLTALQAENQQLRAALADSDPSRPAPAQPSS